MKREQKGGGRREKYIAESKKQVTIPMKNKAKTTISAEFAGS